jgi:hypothetical protein
MTRVKAAVSVVLVLTGVFMLYYGMRVTSSLLPSPAPRVHDEFSYLLAADTYAHGRLANPPHPMWIYFDTIHVNQFPTYMSKYPPAQGAILALGELLGNPWIGVLLSIAAMCGTVLWALQGWLPPRWALLGGALVAARFAAFNYWVDSYWGGAAAAIGGALVVGALPRILHHKKRRDAAILGIGASILALSRPFEGLFFCVPVAVYLIRWMASGRGPKWPESLSRIVLPAGIVLILSVTFLAYDNWRVTNSPFLFPYVLNDRTYLSTPHFIWGQMELPKTYGNPQFDDFYNGWTRQRWVEFGLRSKRRGVPIAFWKIANVSYVYLWPDLFLAGLAAPWLIRDRRVRFLLCQLAICFAGVIVVVWYEPHYSAAITATIFCVAIQGLRHMRQWTIGDRPVGRLIVPLIAVVPFAMIPVQVVRSSRYPGSFPLGTPSAAMALTGIDARATILKDLDKLPGEHLMIVRYSSKHNPLQEWVYNRADIDHAKVVWARELPNMRPLLTYFRGRKFWLVEPDANPVRVTSYDDALAPQ